MTDLVIPFAALGVHDLLAHAQATPALVAAGAGFTVAFMVTGFAALRPTARGRVSSRVLAMQEASRPYKVTVSPFRDRRASPIPLFDSLLRGRSWTANTRERLASAGIPLRVGEYLALRVLTVVIGIGVGLLLGSRSGGGGVAASFFALAGFGVGIAVLPMVISNRARRRRSVIDGQLVELCDVMGSMLRSGYGYAQALSATANEVGPPLSVELRQLLDTVRLGGDIDEALEELERRLQSRDFEMVASAISIQRRSGGNLAEILEGVAGTIRERQSFFREVQAITSKERFSALLVAAFPLSIIAVLTLMAPETYGLLFTDPIGRVMLGVAVALDAVGFFIIHKLVKVEV